MRIAAVSDLHGKFPEIPECDVLIVGGDLCPDGFGRKWAQEAPDRQLDWFKDTFIPWAIVQPAADVLLTWGNHDFCGYLLTESITKVGSPHIKVVVDDAVTIDGVKFWLSPWSPKFMDWAWMEPDNLLGLRYDKIPFDVDVLVSHCPPYGCGDVYPNPDTNVMEHVGSSALRYAIEQKQPPIVICGHLHGGYGQYQIDKSAIHNVAVLNEQYVLTNPATVIDYAQ